MPGIKGVNCTSIATVSPSPPLAQSDFAAIKDEKWKFYDNPFFAAAVASAVVEATLNKSQEFVDHDNEQALEKKPKRSNDRESLKKFSSGTVSSSRPSSRVASPQTARINQQRSPEMKKQSKEDTIQKLRVELLNAWTTIERLEKAHAEAKSKVERLSHRFEDSRSLWESQVQDKITSSLQAMKHKLKEERNANKTLELTNQKLETELLETRSAIAQAKKEMVAERNSKRMIEDVCDELAKEVGDDRALVIELRRQSTSARREAEETRKTLQMGEVWKEEKVQGRLADARFDMEYRIMELNGSIAKIQGFLDERKMVLEEAPTRISSGSNSSTSMSSPREKKVYREQTRLLLNGSGFHLRNKAYNRGNGNGQVVHGGKAVVPKIWPTSTNKT